MWSEANDSCPRATSPNKLRFALPIGSRVLCVKGTFNNHEGTIITKRGKLVRIDFDELGMRFVLLTSVMPLKNLDSPSSRRNIDCITQSKTDKESPSGILKPPKRIVPGYKVAPPSRQQRRVSFFIELDDDGCDQIHSETEYDFRSPRGMEEFEMPSLSPNQSEKRRITNLTIPQESVTTPGTTTGKETGRPCNNQTKSSRRTRKKDQALESNKRTMKKLENSGSRILSRVNPSLGRGVTNEDDISFDVGTRIQCSFGTYKGLAGTVKEAHGKMATIDFDGLARPRRVMKASLRSPIAHKKW
jgi:hypothetical protein